MNNENSIENNKENTEMNNTEKTTNNIFAETIKDGLKNVFGSAKTMATIAIAAILITVGCKTLPDTDTVEKLAKATGYAAGYACELGKIDQQTRTNILYVVDIVDNVIPQTNQSFTTAWMPIVTNEVTKLVEQKKIDEKQGEIIVLGMATATKSLDWLFEVRHPEWKKHEDIVCAAVHGFTEGFTNVIKPVEMSLSSCNMTDDELKEFAAATEYLNK